jgi:hypothetical protein
VADAIQFQRQWFKIQILITAIHLGRNMPISDFDSNGLIFALDFQASQEMFGSVKPETYNGAVKNIMEAQGFSIFPLVNQARVRRNINDMTRRPVYKGSGEITEIAFTRQETVFTATVGDVLQVKEDAKTLTTIQRLAEDCSIDPARPFVALVLRKGSPVAMFTPRELISNRLKDAIIKAFVGDAIGTTLFKDRAGTEFFNQLHELLSAFQSIHDLHSVVEIGKSHESNEINPGRNSQSEELLNAYVKIKEILGGGAFESTDLSSRRYREHTQRHTPSQALVSDAMRFGAAGVLYEDSDRSRLAAKLLSVTNDFDHLVAYNALGTYDQRWVLDRDSNKIPAVYVQHTSLLFDALDKLFIANTPVFVSPSNLQTGEGPMVWPSLLTYSDVDNIHGALWTVSRMVQLELKIQNCLPFSRTSKINTPVNDRPYEVSKLSLSLLKKCLSSKEWCRKYKLKYLGGEFFPGKSLIKWRNDFVHSQISDGGVSFKSGKGGRISKDMLVNFGKACKKWDTMSKKELNNIDKTFRESTSNTTLSTEELSSKSTIVTDTEEKVKSSQLRKSLKSYTKEEVNRLCIGRLSTVESFKQLDFSTEIDAVWALRNFDAIFHYGDKVNKQVHVHPSLHSWFPPGFFAIEKSLVKERLSRLVHDGMTRSAFVAPLC